MLSFVAAHWTEIVAAAAGLLAGFVGCLKLVAPLTETKLDDQALSWMEKALGWMKK